MPLYHQLLVNPGTGQERQAKRLALLQEIEAITSRPVIVYAANLAQPNVPNSIDHSDLTPFSDLTRSLKGDSVDVLLHSPGGLAEAAERIVHLLRARFKHVRFIIPHTAFSAATMLASSADQLILDDTSTLGPIDPQIISRDPQTGQAITVPTQAILDGFNHAKDAIKKNPETLGVYLPLLNRLDLSLFEICKNAEKLARSLVTTWLEQYLLKDEDDPKAKAEEVARYLSDHNDRLSHSRAITLTTVKEDLKISRGILDLREHPNLRNLISELWAEVQWFTENTGTAKLFENAYGVAFRRTFQIQQPLVQAVPLFPMPPQPPVRSPKPPSPPKPPSA